MNLTWNDMFDDDDEDPPCCGFCDCELVCPDCAGLGQFEICDDLALLEEDEDE